MTSGLVGSFEETYQRLRAQLTLFAERGHGEARAELAATSGSLERYRDLFGRRHDILSGRVEAGYGWGWDGSDLPLFERFYLGGPNSVRGFKFRRLSPIDASGVRIGGDTELLGNVEYIIPLPFNIRLAGFFDVGQVYGFNVKFDPTNLREAAGAGVRWISPFGPIRIDYGVNLDRRAGEEFGAFHFSVGSPF